jgi:acyl-CoA dehydrogenase
LAKLYAHARTLRIADGPDAVHIEQIGRAEISRASKLRSYSKL